MYVATTNLGQCTGFRGWRATTFIGPPTPALTLHGSGAACQPRTPAAVDPGMCDVKSEPSAVLRSSRLLVGDLTDGPISFASRGLRHFVNVAACFHQSALRFAPRRLALGPRQGTAPHYGIRRRLRCQGDRTQRARGVSLLELLVALGIVSILFGLILPAVHSAREAARRAQCSNNLRQLAAGVLRYVDNNNLFPIGSFMMNPPGNPQGGPGSGSHEHSFLIRVLPYVEQISLFSAFNSNLHYTLPANTTVLSFGFPLLWCPSDSSVSMTSQSLSLSGPLQLRHTSYRANSGTWSTPCRIQDSSSPDFLEALNQANGIVYYYSRTSLANITDGTSRTMLLGEGAFGKLSEADQHAWHWWASGNYADTMYNTLYPLNSIDRFRRPGAGNGYDSGTKVPFVSGASSMHPSGGHFAFCDGSVLFVKDSIDTMPFDQDTGFPSQLTYVPYDAVSRRGNLYYPLGRLGLYQALSTRNGGDLSYIDFP